MAMSILNHVEGETDEFRAYLKASSIMRRAKDDTEESIADEDVSLELSTERYAELAAKEQVILTVASNGQGKRTSSYEYRLTNRGGKGVISMMLSKSNSDMVSSFPIDENDEIMLIDDNGQLIRCPVSGIRIMGRNTQGVKIITPKENEKLTECVTIPEEEDQED